MFVVVVVVVGVVIQLFSGCWLADRRGTWPVESNNITLTKTLRMGIGLTITAAIVAIYNWLMLCCQVICMLTAVLIKDVYQMRTVAMTVVPVIVTVRHMTRWRHQRQHYHRHQSHSHQLMWDTACTQCRWVTGSMQCLLAADVRYSLYAVSVSDWIYAIAFSTLRLLVGWVCVGWVFWPVELSTVREPTAAWQFVIIRQHLSFDIGWQYVSYGQWQPPLSGAPVNKWLSTTTRERRIPLDSESGGISHLFGTRIAM